MQRRAFVSYAREDAVAAERLGDALRTLHCDVWRDEALSGGQAWWDVILDRVLRCEVFVCAVSPAMLGSTACAAELDYAARLRRPLLPVIVAPLPLELLPPVLAVVQAVDVTDGAPDPGLALAGAILALPPAPPVPVPRPAPPPVPISYLSGLGERVRAPVLTADEQTAIAVRLEEASTRRDERVPAALLARTMLERDDLLHRTATRLERVLAAAASCSGTPGRHGAGWAVRLVDRHKRVRSFQIGDGSRTWLLHLELFPHKVFVDGVRVAARTALRNGYADWTFGLPGAPQGTGSVAFACRGVFRVAGLVLRIDGEVAYQEGTPPAL